MALGTLDGGRKSLGNLSAQQHLTHVKSARNVIMVVAILMLLVGGFLYSVVSNASDKLESNITAIQNNPNQVVDSAKVEAARSEIMGAKIINGIILALGVVFIGLFFWAKTKPYEACLTALILYVMDFVVGLLYNSVHSMSSSSSEPQFNIFSFIIPIAIIVYLKKGMDAGKAYNDIMAAEALRQATEAGLASNPVLPPPPPLPPMAPPPVA